MNGRQLDKSECGLPLQLSWRIVLHSLLLLEGIAVSLG